MENKRCSKCKEVKPAGEFGRRSDCAGYVSACRDCERARGRVSSAKKRATNEGKFDMQAENARRRGIEFLLTYEQWLDIWESSGKLNERGRGAGKYCMCRTGDEGAYEIGNVFIGLNTQNLSDGNLGRVLSAEHREKISASNKGQPHPWSVGQNNPMHRPEVKAKMSAAISGENHYNQRGVNTPQGYFVTAKLAAEALGIKKPTVEWRARHNKFGFSLPAIA